MGIFNTGARDEAAAIMSDSRFVYAQGAGDTCNGGPAFAILIIGDDGTLTPVTNYPVQTGSMLKAGNFLAQGRGQSLFIYAVDRKGNLTQVDTAPILALAVAADAAADNLWVATDDGIVTYKINGAGKLTRISKAFVTTGCCLVLAE